MCTGYRGPHLQCGNFSSRASSKSTSPWEPRLNTWHGSVSSSLLKPQVLRGTRTACECGA